LAVRRRLIKFAVGRINFIDWKGGEDDYEGKSAFLIEALRLGKEYPVFKDKSQRDIKYTWLVLDFHHDIKKKFIFGRLVKERMESGSAKIDRKSRKLLLGETTEAVTYKYVNFALDLESHIVIFEERSPIYQEDFRKALAGIYNPSPDIMDAPIAIDLVVSEQDVYAFVEKVDRVTSMRLRIIPSNPHPKRANEKVDNALKQLEAEAANIDIKGPAGLHIDPNEVDNPFTQALSHAAGGYGDIDLAAEKDGKPDTFSSKKNYRKTYFERALESAPSFIQDVYAKLREAVDAVNEEGVVSDAEVRQQET
jgi:hypothetical protein